MSIATIPGVKSKVAFVSIADLVKAPGGAATADTLFLSGGVCSTIFTPEQLAQCLANETVQSEPESMDFFKSNPKSIINVLTDLANLLTPEEVWAILVHEDGHIELNHLLPNDSTDSVEMPSGGKLANVLQFELDADQYALANGVTPVLLHTALTKTITNMRGFIARIHGEAQATAWHIAVTADENYKRRMQVLADLM